MAFTVRNLGKLTKNFKKNVIFFSKNLPVNYNLFYQVDIAFKISQLTKL